MVAAEGTGILLAVSSDGGSMAAGPLTSCTEVNGVEEGGTEIAEDSRGGGGRMRPGNGDDVCNWLPLVLGEGIGKPGKSDSERELYGN